MLHHKSLAREVCKRVRRFPNFAEVQAMADGLSGSNFLVGGKVYRTILEIEYGKTTSPEDVDWDFLSFDTSLQHRVFPGWQQTRGPGGTGKTTKRPSIPHSASSSYTINLNGTQVGSSTLINLQQFVAPPSGKKSSAKKKDYLDSAISRAYESETKGKLDIIAIEDIHRLYPKHWKKDLSLYLKAVPLDIQSIIIDMKNELLYGAGLQAIRDNKISVNNPVSVLIEGDINDYLRNKGEQLNMPVVEWVVRTECICDSKALLHYGCKCGFLKGLRNGHSI